MGGRAAAASNGVVVPSSTTRPAATRSCRLRGDGADDRGPVAAIERRQAGRLDRGEVGHRGRHQLWIGARLPCPQEAAEFAAAVAAAEPRVEGKAAGRGASRPRVDVLRRTRSATADVGGDRVHGGKMR